MVIVGGGFAGVEAAIKLRGFGYDVTLISDRDYLFIYPISIWIPVGGINFDQVQLSLVELGKRHGFKLIVEPVVELNVNNKQVILQTQQVNYDYLIIAVGMSKVHTDGLEHTHSICGAPIESVKIKELLDKIVERGSGNIAIGFGANPGDPTATAIRGGPAFELLFNISHFIKKKGLRDTVQVHFFAPMKEPGKKLGDKAYDALGKFYQRYRIQAHTGKKIKQFTKLGVVFEDETVLDSDLTIFISGGAGHSLLKNSGLPLSVAGFVKIESTCQVVNHPEIYAIGDVAEIVGPDWAAKQGHIAEVMADVATYNIHQLVMNTQLRKSYQDRLSIICMMDSGDGAALIIRTTKGGRMIVLPVVGHWLKRAWGTYYRFTKLKKMMRIPGL